MQATTLQCFSCGAPARSDSVECGHCSARLATVACPGCFGMMFAGSRFCPHCGERGDRWDQGEGVLACPTCRRAMLHTRVGPVDLQECPGCQGLWLDSSSVELVVRTAETQVAVLHRFPVMAAPGPPEPVRYRRCPACDTLMNRRNFARGSGVVVDVCRPHGTWFDREELSRVVEFIRTGGLDRARQREVEDLEERKRRATSPSPAATPGGGGWIGGSFDASSANILGGLVEVAWQVLSDG